MCNKVALLAEVKFLREQNKYLKEELADCLTDAFVQIASYDKETGWYCSDALSTAVNLGDTLVELGGWEIKPDGVGRVQYYRPIKQNND